MLCSFHFGHDFRHIIFQHTRAGFLAGQTATAETNVFAPQGKKFHIMSGIPCALFTLFCQNFGIAVASQASGDNKNFFRHRNIAPQFKFFLKNAFIQIL